MRVSGSVRLVPFVVAAGHTRNVEPELDAADLEHLIAQQDLPAVPRG
jgi:hypothetical protein